MAESEAAAPAAAAAPADSAVAAEADKPTETKDADMESASSTDAKPEESAPAVVYKCANCGTEGAKLRCSVCKRDNARYCSRDCQKADWKFHRRTCKSPETKKKEEEARKKQDKKDKKEKKKAKASSEGSSAPKSKPLKGESTVDEAEVDEDDEEALKSIQKGYRYFSRKLPEHEEKLIGDIMPQKLSAAGTPEATPRPVEAASGAADAAATAPSASGEAGAGGAGGGGGAAPAAGGSAPHAPLARAGSQQAAWNTGGTWEERDVTSWAKTRLEELLTAAVPVDLPGGAEVSCTGLEGWDGDLQVVFSRGKKRFAYDFKFTALLETRDAEGTTGKAKVAFLDVCNGDDDWDVDFSLGSPKPGRDMREPLRAHCKAGDGAVYKALSGAVRTLLDELREQ